jgi:hypothetical protein
MPAIEHIAERICFLMDRLTLFSFMRPMESVNTDVLYAKL